MVRSLTQPVPQAGPKAGQDGARDHGRLGESIYCPPQTEDGWRLESLLGGREFRYFSYGRRALVEALRMAGVGEGEAVGLPSLICRDVLSAVHALGAVPRFYPVGEALHLAGPAALLPPCRALLAVNYFGFPQTLGALREHCRRTGAALIEDNAHGLFSRDETGAFLGTRGDLGIFSLRKTLPLPNGAALVLNSTDGVLPLGPQQAFDTTPVSATFRLKQWARRMAPLLGCRNFHRLLTLVRGGKRTAGALSRSGRDRLPERVLPEPVAPWAGLSRPLPGDVVAETARRRALYAWLDGWLPGAGLGARPVFAGLPDWVVPYGYPFYVDASHLPKVRAALGRQGLDCLRWPDLPETVRGGAPAHYTSLTVVPFQW